MQRQTMRFLLGAVLWLLTSHHALADELAVDTEAYPIDTLTIETDGDERDTAKKSFACTAVSEHGGVFAANYTAVAASMGRAHAQALKACRQVSTGCKVVRCRRIALQ